MKIYFLVVIVVLLTIAEFGYIAPSLISADSTELVLLGVLSLVVYFPVMYFIIRGIINLKQKSISTSSEVSNNE